MKKYTTGLVLFSLLFASSCSNFDELNTNPDKTTKVPSYMLATGALVGAMKHGGDSKAYISGSALPKYVTYVESGALAEQYNSIGSASFGVYSRIPNLDQMVENSLGTPLETSYKGLALFLKAYEAFRLTMMVGDIPYSDAGKGLLGIAHPKYDTQQEVLQHILADLKTAETLFATGQTFTGDIVYSGDPAKWRKACNALQLKVIMSMSKKVDATLKARFGEIVTAGNLLQGNADNFQLKYLNQAGNYHPLYQAQKFTANTMLSLMVTDNLKALKDRRLFYYGDPSAVQLAGGKPSTDMNAYVGVNAAMSYANLTLVHASKDISFINKRYATLSTSEPLVYLGFPEQSFIIAEAIERGWIAGSSQSYYEAGVKAALAFTAATDPLYANGMPINQAYIDAYFTGEAAYKASSADRLKQIWLQKYLFNFMQDGLFSYLEFRRTGYPEFPLDPATNMNAENKNGFPVRWTYPAIETQTNNDNKTIALKRQFTNGYDGNNELMWLLK